MRSLLDSIRVEGKNIPEAEAAEIAEEISSAFRDLENQKDPNNAASILAIEEDLKSQMAGEPDWRRKAAIAARIVSLNL